MSAITADELRQRGQKPRGGSKKGGIKQGVQPVAPPQPQAAVGVYEIFKEILIDISRDAYKLGKVNKGDWGALVKEARNKTAARLVKSGSTAKAGVIKNVIYDNENSDIYNALVKAPKHAPVSHDAVLGRLDGVAPLVRQADDNFIATYGDAAIKKVIDILRLKNVESKPTEHPLAEGVRQENERVMSRIASLTPDQLLAESEEQMRQLRLDEEKVQIEHVRLMKNKDKMEQTERVDKIADDIRSMENIKTRLTDMRQRLALIKEKLEKENVRMPRDLMSGLENMETSVVNAYHESRSVMDSEPQPPPKPTLPPKPTKQPDPTPPKPPLPPRPPKPPPKSPPEEPLKPPVTITPAPTEKFVVVKKGGRGGKKGGSVDTYREGLLRQAVKDVQDIHDKASRSSNPERFSDQLNRALRTVFELKTGIDLSKVPRDGQTIKTMGDILDNTFQTLAGAAQEFGISEKGLKFLGSHKGGMEGLVRDDEPLNLLDGIAKRHDMEYLIASTESDSQKQQEVQRHADQAMLDEIEKLMPKLDPRSNQYKDSSAAYTAISTKMYVDSQLQKTGISPSAWLVTPNVEKLDPESIPDRFSRLANEMQSLSRDLNDVVDPSERVSDVPYGDYIRDYGTVYVHGYEPPEGESEEEEYVPHPPEPVPEPESGRGPYTHPPEVGGSPVKEPEVGGVVRDGDGGVKVGPELTVYNQQAVKKVPMTLDGLLGELQKMNSGSKDPSNIYSLKPVTGERNMRPLLVKGDYAGVLDRTKKEEEDNMTFYAKWKNIESGWGNGNQEALPDQILPAKNTVLRAQRENENYKFSDNFDGGARNWYEETYRPAMKKQMVVHSKRVNSKWAVPMIRNNQTHQLPVRNGALPAGAGRPIQFSRDTQNGFDIYTPYQRLNARQTRLFNGDVVDGRRV